jgi:tetratricopeptide (TPR) repeat protein
MNLVTLLSQHYDHQKAAVVLAMLRQDPLVLRKLTQDKIIQKVAPHVRNGNFVWSPGRLAILALSEYDTWLKSDMSDLHFSASITQKASAGYEAQLLDPAQLVDLSEAGLIAIGMRDFAHLSNSWRDLLQGVFSRKGQYETSSYILWRTVLTCLYGFIKDQHDMLQALVESSVPYDGFQLAVHVILSNYDEKELHEERLAFLLSKIPKSLWVPCLKWLDDQGRSELAKDLAIALEKKMPSISIEDQVIGESQLEASLEIRRRALLLQISGQYDRAGNNLAEARNLASGWMDSLEAQAANLEHKGGRKDQISVEEILKKTASPKLRKELIIALNAEFGNMVEFDLVGELSGFPLIQIKAAQQIAKEQGIDAGKALASESVDRLLTHCETVNERNDDLLFSIDPSWVIRDLIKLEMNDEALQLGLKYLEIRPSDSAIMNLISELHFRNGDLEKSFALSSQCTILFPENAESHRQMAEVLEAQNRWDRAFDERQKVLQFRKAPLVDDWIAFASNSLKVCQPRLAVDACTVILETEPNHQKALQILGKAYYELEDFEIAEKYLQMSIPNNAVHSEPPMLLADIYRKTGRPEMALDILSQAADQFPQLVEIQKAIADLCFAQGWIEQGLNAGKAAYSLNPESLDVVKLLGNALFKNERYQESDALISSAYRHWPEDSELAFLLAQLKLKLDQPDSALPLLEKVVISPLVEDVQKLVYVKAIFGGDIPVAGVSLIDQIDWDHLKKARAFLEEMLTGESRLFEVRYLLSEVYAAQREDVLALESYQKTSEFLEANQEEWRRRIYRGLGLTAFRLNKFDIALVAFQSIWELDVNDPWLSRLLAETYLALGLQENAWQVARTVVDIESNWLNLSWYSWFLSIIGEKDQACDLLESVLAIAPQSYGVLLEFAELLLSAGNRLGAEFVADFTLQMEGLEIDSVKQVSKMFLRCGNQENAIAALERGIFQESHVKNESFIELLALYTYTNKFTKAIELIGKAPQEIQNDKAIMVLKSDLLRTQGDWPSVIDILKVVSRQVLASQEELKLFQWRCEDNQESIDFGFDLVENTVGLYCRLASLLYMSGSFSQALDYAVEGLNAEPSDPVLLQLVLSLNKALLVSEENNKYIEKLMRVAEQYSDQNNSNLPRSNVISGVLGHYIEWALDEGNIELAGVFLNDVFAQSDHIRFVSLRIRLLFLEGKRAEANQQYDRLQKIISAYGEQETVTQFGGYAFGLDEETKIMGTVWCAEAARVLKKHGDYYRESKSASQKDKSLPLIQYSLLDAILRCFQERSLCQELLVRHHIPCRDIRDEEFISEYEAAYAELGGILDDNRRQYWEKKGAMVVRPSMETVSEFMRCSYLQDDIPGMLISLRRAGKTPEAIIDVFEQYESDAYIQGQLALCVLDNPARALEFAHHALAMNPNDPYLLMILSLSANADHDYHLAYQSIDKALELWPQEAKWGVYAAELAIKMDKVAEAFSHFNKAVSIEPKLEENNQKLGEAFLREGDSSNAIIMLESHQGSKNTSESLMMLAVAYRMDGKIDKALEIGDRACRFDPAFSYPYKFCGQIAAEMGKNDLALKYFRKASQTNPQDSETAIAMSRLFVAQGDWVAGLKILNGQDIEQPVIALERAKIVYQQGNLDDALHSVEEIAMRDPDHDEALMFLAQMKAESGYSEEARQLLIQALQKKPDHSAAYALLGSLSYYEGQLDQAVHNYSEAIRYSPAELENYLKLGEIFHDRREFVKALQIYNQAMKVAPEHVTPFLESAMVFKEMKDYVNAELMLRRAAELEPRDLRIHRQLGALVALNLVHNSGGG